MEGKTLLTKPAAQPTADAQRISTPTLVYLGSCALSPGSQSPGVSVDNVSAHRDDTGNGLRAGQALAISATSWITAPWKKTSKYGKPHQLCGASVTCTNQSLTTAAS